MAKEVTMTRVGNWLKHHWPELLVFAALAIAFLIATSPNLQWMMVDSDGPEYVLDAKYFYPAHHTSAPLYLLMGHVFLQLPFGTDYWKMSLMSGVFTLGTCLFLYLIIRHFIQGNKGRWYGLLAAVIFGGSMLAFAQAIVVETYAVVTFFSVGAYYFTLRKQWYLVAAFLGMGLVTHHLILLTWIVLFIAHKELRFNRYKVFGKSVPFFSKYFLVSAAFLLFYLYMPLSVRFTDQPNMWGNTGLKDFFTNNIGVFTMLVGQLSIYDFPKRVLDTLGVLGVSFALASIPLVWWLWKNHKLRTELMWLFALPIVYYCFPAGTKIITIGKSHGKLGNDRGRRAKSIEDITVGDVVLTYNDKTGIKEWKPVTKTYKHQAERFVYLKLSNGNELKCTNNHPIGVVRSGKVEWVDADLVQIGDEVVQAYYHNWQRRIAAIESRGKSIEDIFGEVVGKKHRLHNRLSHVGGKGNPKKPTELARRRMSESHLGQLPSEYTRRLVGEAARANWRRPEYRQKIQDKVQRTLAKRWAEDPVFAQRMLGILLKAQHMHGKPTAAELRMKELLDTYCPNEFAYDGDGKLGMLGRYAPDFVNINGKKQVVEVLGCYHHNCPECNQNYTVHGVTPEERRAMDAKKLQGYEALGYKCLVVWGHELKPRQIEATVQRLKNFLYNPDAEVVKVIGLGRYQERQTVYNIETADNHNYFAHGILVHNCSDLAPQVAKYMEASIAWGAIMAVLAISQMGGVRRFFNKKVLIGATAVGAVAMLGVNTYALDIGRTLDPNLSATKFYQEELPKMQDGDIFVTNGAWEWIEVFLYNKEEGHSIIPVCMGILPSERYRNLLRERGVVIDEIPLGLEGTRSHNLNEQQVYYSLNIVDKNQNVWTSRSTDPSTYGAEVVVADTNRDQFLKWLGHDIVRPAWHWKPTNPYFVVGGQVETTEWIFILQSNRTVIWLATLVGLGWIAGWAVSQLRRRSGKAKKG